ncbi:unnamed protein product [Amaranthus hypochondriacus]
MAIAGLHVSFVVANYYFSVLITLFTDIWQLKLYQAFMITNFYTGIKSILGLFIAILADAIVGDSWTLLYTSFLYFLGLVMFFFIYPSTNHEEIIACQERDICKEKTIGWLFYLTMVLIAIGQCGYNNYIKSLDWEFEKKNAKKFNEQTSFWKQAEWVLKKIIGIFRRKFALGLIGLLLAIFFIPTKSYRAQNMIRASMFGASLIIFAARMCYECPFKASEWRSPIITVFNVIRVAIKNRDYDITTGEYQYYSEEVSEDQTNYNINETMSRNDMSSINGSNDGENLSNSYTTKVLEKVPRFLNKAALYKVCPENPDAEIEKRRLHSIKEVIEAKVFLRGILPFLAISTYGMVTAVSSTLFVEQANKMNRHLQSVHVPVQLIKYSSSAAEYSVLFICKIYSLISKEKKRFHGALRMSFGMFFSGIGFYAAHFVEVERLKSLRSGINLTAFWIIPQLICMGIMKGVARGSIVDYVEKKMPDSIRITYGTILTEAIIGGGQLIWMAVFVIVDKITNPGWIGDRINNSRLDKLYLVMMICGFSFSIFFLMAAFVRCFFNIKSSTSASARAPASASSSEYQVITNNLK